MPAQKLPVPPDVFFRLQKVTSLLWETPLPTREVAAALDTPWVTADRLLKRLAREGWVIPLGAARVDRGRKLMLWAATKVPGSQMLPDPTPDPERAATLDKWRMTTLNYFYSENVEFLSVPRTAREFAEHRGVTMASAINTLTEMVKEGSLFMAGKAKQRRGPPAQLYCASRVEASRSILKWWVAELKLR